MKNVMLVIALVFGMVLATQANANDCQSVRLVNDHEQQVQVQRVRVVQHVQPVQVEYVEITPAVEQHVQRVRVVQRVEAPVYQVQEVQEVVVQEVRVVEQVNSHCNQSVQRLRGRNRGVDRSFSIERSVQR